MLDGRKVAKDIEKQLVFGVALNEQISLNIKESGMLNNDKEKVV